ncbi:diaminopimelate dehydrogenase [Facklamia miroungae]|uniref:Meso-diaminopimelate D-dehydrogenase n=1 Tax=Facklamia miroungae TaxID=120956 RepID=A0A1G7PT40_9LACT|nr:diaminopimelate dehydrogenase [Facklamia miroungae]NKZ28818.1 diaminopimelate dehydrogenase [Facklamia miroungae]SDF89404.1 diaminopimelate dehydrogenase [Facklamia miroungae]
MAKIKLGVIGFDQLGQEIVSAVQKQEDLMIASVFTHFNKKDLSSEFQTLPLHSMNEVFEFKQEIDVLIVCSGSTIDYPSHLTDYARYYNVVEAYNFYAQPNLLINSLESMSPPPNKLALIGVGWNPGLYSLNQIMAESLIPNATTYHFVENEWSQKMTELLEEIEGVAEAKVFLNAEPTSLEAVLAGQNPNLNYSDYHQREAYLVLEEGIDPEKIHDQIQVLPNYLSQAQSHLHFVSSAELAKLSQDKQAGRLIRSSSDQKELTTYDLSLCLSHPLSYQANILMAYARAVFRLAKEGKTGALTMLDIPLSYLSKLNRQDLIDQYL